MTVLVLSNRQDQTADYLCAKMLIAGLDFVRLDTEYTTSSCSISAASTGSHLVINGRPLRSSEVGTIWYRRPEPPRHSEDSSDTGQQKFALLEWTAALEGFLAQVPLERWVSHPARIMAAGSKLEQLVRASGYGFLVPDWVCTTSADEARAFVARHKDVIAKPLYSGYIEREPPLTDSVIYTSRVRENHFELFPSALGAPTLFQKEIREGVDVRVTVVDGRMVAVALTRNEDASDIRRNNMSDVRYSAVEIPPDLEKRIIKLSNSYQLRFSALDFMKKGDDWYFLEINPNGQWAWLDLVGASEIYRLFLSSFGASK